MTVSERILLHLKRNAQYEDAGEVSARVTQKGIAEAVNISISHVPRAIKRLIEGELVREEKTYVRGRNRRLKAYFLTERGYERANSIKNRILDVEISIIYGGEGKRVKVGDIWDKVTLSELYSAMDPEKRAISISQRGKRGGITGSPPDVRGFVGRERELEKMEHWFDDAEHSVLVIYGSRGIGKSYLLSRYARDIQNKSEIFWFDLSVVTTAGQVYTRLGSEGGVEELAGSINGRFLVFDGYYEPDEEFVEFFSELVKRVVGAKILISARDNTPYYTRFYDPKKDDHIEEMTLKGFTTAEIGEYLGADHENDAIEGDIKQVWQLTNGKPAILKALCDDDIKGLKSLGLTTEESRLLIFIKNKIVEKA